MSKTKSISSWSNIAQYLSVIPSQMFYDYPYYKTANEKHIYGRTVQPPRPASYSNRQQKEEDWWGIFPT